MSKSSEKQTPIGEVAERVAEASPGLMMPRMVETVHWNRQRKDYRRQIEHDRTVQAARLAGKNPPEWSKHDERDEDDDMGDSFSIAGDTTHHHYPTPEPSAPQPTPPPTQPGLTPLQKAVVAAGLIVGGLGAGLGLAALLNKDQQPPPAILPAPSVGYETYLDLSPPKKASDD